MTEGVDCDGAAADGDEVEVGGLWIICGSKSAIFWYFQCSKKKPETPGASVVQMSDGRLLGKLKDGKYGIRGLSMWFWQRLILQNMSGIFRNGQWILEN